MISFKKKIFDVSSIVSQLRSETRNVQLTQHVAAILIIRGRKVKHWGVAFDHKGYISALLDRHFQRVSSYTIGILKVTRRRKGLPETTGPRYSAQIPSSPPRCFRFSICFALDLSIVWPVQWASVMNFFTLSVPLSWWPLNPLQWQS